MNDCADLERIIDLPEGIVARFGVSDTVARQVLALATQDIYVTAAMLGLAGRMVSATKLLMDKELMEDGLDFGRKAFLALAGKLQLSAFGVDWIAQDDHVILTAAPAPEEATDPTQQDTNNTTAEILEEAPDKRVEDAERSLLSVALQSQETGGDMDAADMFTPAKLTELRLVIFTSTHPEAKIEAIRLTGFAPFSNSEKGKLLLKALSDHDASVRAEAASALKHLGLHSEVADALRDLALGQENRRRHALGVLKRWIPAGNEAELGSILISLISGLDDPTIKSIKREYLEVFREVCMYVARQPTHLRELANRLFQQFVTAGSDVFAVVRDIFVQLAEHSNQEVEEILWEKYELEESPRIKRYLLLTLGSIELSDGVLDQMMHAALGDVIDNNNYMMFEWLFKRSPDRGAQSIMQALSVDLPPSKQLAYVKLLDRVCYASEISEKTVSAAAKYVLNIAKLSPRAVRHAVLGSLMVRRAIVDPDVRERFAGELLISMHEAALISDLNETVIAISNLGWPALEPVLSFVGNHLNDYQLREMVVEAVPRMILDGRLAGKEAQQSVNDGVKKCLERVADAQESSRGLFVQILGMLVSLPFVRKDVVRRVCEGLIKRIWKIDETYHLLHALEWCVRSPKMDPHMRARIGRLFMGLFSQSFPDVELTSIDTKDGKLFDVDPQANAHVVMVPALIRGMVNVINADPDDEATMRLILKGFLKKWAMVSTWREVWSPLNINALVVGMTELARFDKVPQDVRLDIIRQLYRHFVQFEMGAVPVIIALGAVFHEEEMTDLDQEASDVVEKLIQLWKHHESYTEMEKGAVLLTLAQISSRSYLDRCVRDPADYRDTVLRLLYQGLYEGVPGVYQGLTCLADCPMLKEETRAEITERLARFSQLGVWQEKAI